MPSVQNLVLIQLPRPHESLPGHARCALCCGIDSARFAWHCGTVASVKTIFPRAPGFPAIGAWG